MTVAQFNIGKAGLTENFINNLEKTFKNRELVKISILKTGTRDRKEANKIAETICKELKSKLNKDFTYRIVGFTIFIRKWRKLKQT